MRIRFEGLAHMPVYRDGISDPWSAGEVRDVPEAQVAHLIEHGGFTYVRAAIESDPLIVEPVEPLPTPKRRAAKG